MNYPTTLTIQVGFQYGTKHTIQLEGAFIAEPKRGGTVQVTLQGGTHIMLQISDAVEDVGFGRLLVTAKHEQSKHAPPFMSSQELAHEIRDRMVRSGWNMCKIEQPQEGRVPDFSDPREQQRMQGDKQ